MHTLKVSVIVPTYKDIVALKLILDAFSQQTYEKFEVIIAEDDDAQVTKDLLKEYICKYTIKHFFQEDKGNRKPRAVNNAIDMSIGEYIIFIDGDTIPYTTFIESHVKLSNPYVCLCGRRVNLGTKVSNELRNKKISSLDIEKSYIGKANYLLKDNIRHYEQGFYFKPHSMINKILSHFDSNTSIVASNFSCHKDRLLEVNGIDEALPYAPSRDDTDLQWRLESIGVVMKSIKFCANLLHLDHSRNDRKLEDEYNKKLIEIKKMNNEYVCKNGIKKL